uniref:CCHC-type domain-containing protein n=1 Tax=Tanacetum cinerariifolium TaxID=118510 RepID=A0A6L2KV76_TANCI|nr:hypothetical protein [Tanacetum cinerariifolium]
MSDASSAVTYTSVYTDSKPWRYYREESAKTRSPGVIDGDTESSDDDDDDDDTNSDPDEDPEEESFEDEEEEEHLASADSFAVPIIDHVLPAKDTEALEADEPTPTPDHLILLSILPRHVSVGHERFLTNTGASLGYKAAGIRMRALLPSTSCRTDIPEADVPPEKRAYLTTPALGLEVRESSTAGAAIQLGPTESDLRRYRVEQAGYGITDTWDDIVDTLIKIAPTTLEGVDQRVTKLDTTTQLTTALGRIEILEARDLEPQKGPKIAPKKRTMRETPATTTTSTTNVTDAQLQALIDRGVATALAECDADSSRNGDNNNDSGTDERSNCTIACQVKFASCSLQGSALTWWNSHMRAVRQDVAYVMPWVALKRMITDKYCPRGEIQKLESEYWNLKVKVKVERYIDGLLDMIHGSVKASKPQSMQEAVEFPTEIMDKKMLTHAERQAEHKRKSDDTSRNNQHQQQPFKRNNVALPYTVGLGDKKHYGGTKPLCPKCNYHHDGPCAPKCTNCKKIGHLARDCKGRPAAINNNHTNNNNQRAQGENVRRITCFECGVQGHYKSDCPKLKNGNQGNRAGNGNVVARTYAIGTVRTNPNSNVVTGTFLLNNHYALILFDTGADRSFISAAFSSFIDIIPTTLDHGYDVELADGGIIWVNTLIRGCTLNFLNHPFNIDLMPIEMGSFDVIIGMDWLVKYHAVIVCDEKLVRVPFDDKILIFHDDGSNNEHCWVSTLYQSLLY